jgi:hypothetical protein
MESFPRKLHRLVEDARQRSREDVVRFGDQGVGIEVLQPDVFAKEILPEYYRHSRMSSFRRQMAIYGFQRLSDATPASSSSSSMRWHHDLFVRGCPALCASIRRVADRVTTPPS